MFCVPRWSPELIAYANTGKHGLIMEFRKERARDAVREAWSIIDHSGLAQIDPHGLQPENPTRQAGKHMLDAEPSNPTELASALDEVVVGNRTAGTAAGAAKAAAVRVQGAGIGVSSAPVIIDVPPSNTCGRIGECGPDH